MKKIALPLVIALGLLLALMASVIVSRAEPPVPFRTLNSGHHFLPPYPNPRDRFGFDSMDSDPLTSYDVALLNAGWYSDWYTSLNPPHPDDLTYVQALEFRAGPDPHDPAQVTVNPNRATIANIAAAHPGSLWMMGNEPDSIYHGTPIYPDVYAHVYHEFYTYIKSLDPTALIANGGIVQPTPCRMTYLDIIRDTYQQAYGEPMPVDVWNIHAFVLREVYGEWGASTPPGVPTSCAMEYLIRDCDNIDIFQQNLIAFRQWMKDKGEQDKPLIISEYGILLPEYYSWGAPLYDEDGRTYSPVRVSHFMTQTFDLFLYETYPDVGYPEDDYRLVQTWAWYSLSEDQHYNGYLFHSSSKQISPMGQTYANYIAALPDALYADLTIHHNAALDTSPLQNIALGDPYETTSVTLPIWVHIANLGKLPVSDVPVVAETPYAVTNTVTLPGRYATDIVPFAVSIILTQPASYDFAPGLRIVVDPDNTVNDPRPWNNAMTVTIPTTIDARPDLAVLTTAWDVQPTETLSGVLNITLTVANEGMWPVPPVSGTLSLSNAQGSPVFLSQRFPIPALEFGEQVIITEELTLPSPALYYVALETDNDDVVDEPDEDNNQIELVVDARPDLLISTVDWSTQQPGALSDTLHITLTVSNQGMWHAHPVSGTRYLSDTTNGTLLFPAYPFPVPAIAPGDQVTIIQETALPPLLGEDFYRLTLEVDSDEILDEQSENNNRAVTMIPNVVTTTLEPDAASTLTSASGHIVLQFSAGTVATTTELCFIPLWPPELPPGPPLAIEAFRLTTCQDEPPVSPVLLLPVTVTWHYTDTDVVGLDEEKLGLYAWAESDRWQRVTCPAEQHWSNENRLNICIQQLGEYVFGYTYKQHLPLVMRDNGEINTTTYLQVRSEHSRQNQMRTLVFQSTCRRGFPRRRRVNH